MSTSYSSFKVLSTNFPVSSVRVNKDEHQLPHEANDCYLFSKFNAVRRMLGGAKVFIARGKKKEEDAGQVNVW